MRWWVRTGLYSLVYTLVVVAAGVYVLTQHPSPTEAGDTARSELLGMVVGAGIAALWLIGIARQFGDRYRWLKLYAQIPPLVTFFMVTGCTLGVLGFLGLTPQAPPHDPYQALTSKRVQGAGYTLTVPDLEWKAVGAEEIHRRNPDCDRWLVKPALTMCVQTLPPQPDDPPLKSADLPEIEAVIGEMLAQHQGELSFDFLVRSYITEGKLYRVMAWMPSSQFPEHEKELREIVGSFTLDP